MVLGLWVQPPTQSCTACCAQLCCVLAARCLRYAWCSTGWTRDLLVQMCIPCSPICITNHMTPPPPCCSYVANTIDINKDEAEYQWLLKVLSDQVGSPILKALEDVVCSVAIHRVESEGSCNHLTHSHLTMVVHAAQVPTVVEKAIASEGGGDGPRRRGMAFGRAFAAHLAKLQADPGCYGQLGLSDLFEMREECLREFGFSDVYRCPGGGVGCFDWRLVFVTCPSCSWGRPAG